MRSSESVFKLTGTLPVRAISARKMRTILGVEVPNRPVTLLAFANKSFSTRQRRSTVMLHWCLSRSIPSSLVTEFFQQRMEIGKLRRARTNDDRGLSRACFRVCVILRNRENENGLQPTQMEEVPVPGNFRAEEH